MVREALGTAPFRRGLALGRLARSWEAVVGPRLSRETAPLALDEGGLVVSASSAAWGTQVRFLAQDIRRLSNQVLGAEEVHSVRVVVARGSRDQPGERGDHAF